VSVVVDALQPLEQLAAAAREWGTSVDVLVEINAGQDRCGVQQSIAGSPCSVCHVCHVCHGTVCQDNI
jgi:D-serine deaminase-like pyridoxal phosphate-dependent protein